MTEILYERFMAHGPVVRIRRTSPPGETPVTAVLEVDRRAGTPRSVGGSPPPLARASGRTEADARAELEQLAEDDAQVARLLVEKGLR